MMHSNLGNTTPIYRLFEAINENAIFIKRDDLFPFSFGGNKARKVLLFFKELKQMGADSVVTYGTSKSNHCRVVANAAASNKLPCYIVSPREKLEETLNSLMLNIFGATVIQSSLDDVADSINRKMEQLRSEGHSPYFIQGGGHGDLGTKAYVEAYEEIRNYEQENNIKFDYIFLASGTGTTQAGLVCGKFLNNDNKQIVGISIARKNPYGGQVVLDSVNSYLKSIEREGIGSEAINFIDDYVLDGYGAYNNEIIEVIKEVLIREGIPLDTTYTGKGFWGMKKYVEKNHIRDKNILFIHTGGMPLFFDNLGELSNA